MMMIETVSVIVALALMAWLARAAVKGRMCPPIAAMLVFAIGIFVVAYVCVTIDAYLNGDKATAAEVVSAPEPEVTPSDEASAPEETPAATADETPSATPTDTASE